MSIEDPSQTSVSTVLERLSCHLDDLAEEVSKIEHVICNDLHVLGPRHSSNIQQLQSLDLMRQSLEDTALLTLFLSQTSKGVLDAKVARKLRLKTTRDMIVRTSPSPIAQVDQGRSGEVDLF